MAKKQSKVSVIIVQRLLPHYRVPFFELLTSANPDLEIKVFHGDKTMRNNVSPGFALQYYTNYTIRPFGFSLVFQLKLMRDVLFVRPDILVIEGTFGVITNFILLLCRRIMGLPTLYWTAGWNNPEITGWRLWFKSLFIRTSLLFCDSAIVYGSAALQYLVMHGFPVEKITIAQNTIDVESLISKHDYWVEQGKLIRKKFSPNARYFVSYIGQLSPIKRVHILLKAFSILRSKRSDVALLIVGKGEQAEGLRRIVDTDNIPDVYFVGEVIYGVEAFFGASDLFVLPGTGGLALNQAMALGVPVVATIADGTQHDLVIQGQNGYIVAVDDANALSNAIDSILVFSSLEEMKKNSQRIIQEKATLRNMVEQFSSAIRKQLASMGS